MLNYPRPLHDRILVRRDPPKDTSDSGLLHLPENTLWRGDKATVLAVGPGKKTDQGTRKPMSVEVGQIVALPEYAGVEVRHEGVLLALITEDEILAILLDAHPAA
jgi:chaperonin GroES